MSAMGVGRRYGPGPLMSTVLAAALTLTSVTTARSQEQPLNLMYRSGQNVVPVYEGWERNADGSFTMMFGYFNRNWDEAPDIPIGADNFIEPGKPDRGQPTHFLPRRNQFVFQVHVPKDWGNKELVWTLAVHGRSEKAYGSLLPAREVDTNIVAINHRGDGFTGPSVKSEELSKNQPPVVKLEGADQRTVGLGEPVILTAVVGDDGIPKRTPTPATRPPGRSAALGLRVAWFRYRGPGKVTFDPPQFKVNQDPRGDSPWTVGWEPPPMPADGKIVVRASFAEPGTYVLRLLAHDGWISISRDVTLIVKPPSLH